MAVVYVNSWTDVEDACVLEWGDYLKDYGCIMLRTKERLSHTVLNKIVSYGEYLWYIYIYI